MRRMECLDGLRGVLAVYVLLGHMAPFAAAPRWLAGLFSHGGAAVDMFFILSGMVIVGSLERHDCGLDTHRAHRDSEEHRRRLGSPRRQTVDQQEDFHVGPASSDLCQSA